MLAATQQTMSALKHWGMSDTCNMGEEALEKSGPSWCKGNIVSVQENRG